MPRFPVPPVLAFFLLLTLAAPDRGWTAGADGGGAGCTPGATMLCLQGDRFRVEIEWEDFDANSGSAQVLPFASDDTGFFYFTDPEVPDAGVKVLDGTALNGFWWVFYASLTDWEYTITVTDTATGAQKAYLNPLGTSNSGADLSAFSDIPPRAAYRPPAPRGALASAAPRGAPSVCVPGPSTLCLDARRFQVEVDWRDFTSNVGAGLQVPLTDFAGYFYFFSPANVDLMVKIVDAGGSFWFFFGAFSEVEYTITVTDRCTGAEKTYFNPLGNLQSFADLDAFPVTPSCTELIFTDGFESGDNAARKRGQVNILSVSLRK